MCPHCANVSSKSISASAPDTDRDHENMSSPTSQQKAEDDSDSTSVSPSELDASSTIVYDQESFSTFQLRVKNLVLETIWSDAKEADVEIERLKGGGFNRIIGITRHIINEPKHDIRYILRLPRFDTARLDRDVANLQFLQRYSKMPAATVITFDMNVENQIQSSYMIQNRITGTDLYSTFPELTHEDKCRVARDVGNTVNQMLALRSDAAGVLTFAANEVSLTAPLYLASFPSVDPEQQQVPYSKARPTRSVLELLTELFQIQKAASLRDYPNDLGEPYKMDAFCTMASELDADGWLTNLPNCLAHMDFAPRNILVDPTSARDGPIVTAVLDWDSAVLAPIFMACTPPFWIWGWQDDDDEDERMANDDPPDPNNRQLKQIFEAAAGKEYIQFAYGPVYRLARRLARFAIYGMRANEDWPESDEMFAEWERLRAETGASGTQSGLAKAPGVVDGQPAALRHVRRSKRQGEQGQVSSFKLRGRSDKRRRCCVM